MVYIFKYIVKRNSEIIKYIYKDRKIDVHKQFLKFK